MLASQGPRDCDHQDEDSEGDSNPAAGGEVCPRGAAGGETLEASSPDLGPCDASQTNAGGE